MYDMPRMRLWTSINLLVLTQVACFSLGLQKMPTWLDENGKVSNLDEVRKYNEDYDAMFGLSLFWSRKFTRKPEDPFEGPEVYVEAAKEELRRMEAKSSLSHEEKLLKMAIKSLMNLVESSQCDAELTKDLARIYCFYFPSSKRPEISDHVYHHYISRLDMDQCEQFIESKLVDAQKASAKGTLAKFLNSIKPKVSTEAERLVFEKEFVLEPYTPSDFHLDKDSIEKQLVTYVRQMKPMLMPKTPAFLASILTKPCKDLQQLSGDHLQAWLALKATQTRSRAEEAFAKRDIGFKLMMHSNEVCKHLLSGRMLWNVLRAFPNLKPPSRERYSDSFF